MSTDAVQPRWRKTKWICGIALSVVVLFVVVVALQPSEFRVARSAAVSAPPEAVFAQVDTLRNWEAWSPWAKLDPAAKTFYEGPASGVGAVNGWSGNSQVGEGRMTIIESRPNELVRLRLDFEKPMNATCSSEFTFKPDGGRTLVTWSMSGTNGFIAKAFGLFMNCEKMVGSQFETGLAQLEMAAKAVTRK